MAGSRRKALVLYDTATRLGRVLRVANLNRGNALAACENFKGAIEAFSKALEIDPHYAGAHFNLGNTTCASESWNWREAHTSALRWCRNIPMLRSPWARSLKDLRQFESACSLPSSVELQPSYVQVHCNFGQPLKKLNRFEEALTSHRHAIELYDPNYVDAHNNMATVLQDLGRLEEAKSSYTLRALELKRFG